MRISKSNKLCLFALKANILKSVDKKAKGLQKLESSRFGTEFIPYYFSGFQHQRVIRLSKRTYENSKLVNVDTLSDLVQIECSYNDFVILYPFEKMAYVRKMGDEVAFLIVDFIGKDIVQSVGSYNFITQCFFPEDESGAQREFLQILIYLFYGQISWREIQAKQKAKQSLSTWVFNDSDIKVWYANCLWRQRISVSGFKVSGHFRLQPYGKKRAKRKLIWIDEFEKLGYNRQATIELANKKQ